MLSACASDAVPLLAEVKRRCQAQIQAYDACIQAKPSRPLQGPEDEDEEIAQRCTPALRSLWHCTEAVKREAADTIGIKRPDPAKVGMAAPAAAATADASPKD